MNPCLRLAHTIDALNEWLGRFVAWFTLLMVLLTFSIVILRYGFNLSWIAMQESVTYLHALLFTLGAAYTLNHDGHVRVDIFYRIQSPRTKAVINALGALAFLLPVSLFMAWISFDYVSESWRLFESSREAGGLPFVFILKSALVVMPILLALQSVSECMKNVAFLLQSKSHHERD